MEESEHVESSSVGDRGVNTLGEGSQAESRNHHLIQSAAEDMIATYRQALGLESVWSIQVRVYCPDQLPQSEASIWWDAEVWFARLHLRCGLSDEFLTWLVLHELCELQTWRTGSYALQLMQGQRQRRSSAYKEGLQRDWQRLRNQEIEWRIYGLTGCRRPEHLMEGEEFWDGVGSFSASPVPTEPLEEQVVVKPNQNQEEEEQ